MKSSYVRKIIKRTQSSMILMLLIFILFGCTSMPEPVKDTVITKIVDTNKPKNENFDLSMKWIAKTFNSAKSVIEYSDKEAGTINGKGDVKIGNYAIDVFVDFSLVIDVKDQRARLMFTANSYHNAAYPLAQNPIFPEIFDKFKQRVEEINTDYQKYINETNSNW